jgi:RHS repeat-associated protein
MKKGGDLRYVHQDHLTSTSLMTDTNGDPVGTTMKYYPFGVCRNSQLEIDNFPTDRLFTGQRLDGTGLYYYGARYYDASMGRFISPDTLIPNPANPRSFNRYSYCLNNPLKYTDPSGHDVDINGWDVEVIRALLQAGYYLPMEAQQALSGVVHSLEYQIYNAFRYENLDNYLGEQLDSITQKSGSDINIILNNNPYNNVLKANDFYQAGAILSASYDIIPTEFVVPKGVYLAGGIILFIAGTMLTAGGGAAVMVALLAIEPGAIVTAATLAGPLVILGGTAIDLSVNILTEGDVDLATEAFPPNY